MATHLFRVAILCRLWVLSASADAQQLVLDELFPDLDFTRLMMECIPSMERVRESRGEDAEAVKRAAANWDTMEENTEETSPHGFWFSVIFSRMQRGYVGESRYADRTMGAESVAVAERETAGMGRDRRGYWNNPVGQGLEVDYREQDRERLSLLGGIF